MESKLSQAAGRRATSPGGIPSLLNKRHISEDNGAMGNPKATMKEESFPLSMSPSAPRDLSLHHSYLTDEEIGSER